MSTCATRTAALVGFLTGWTSFVAGFAGAMAFSANLLPLYLERFIPGAVELDAVARRFRCRTCAITFSNQTIIGVIAAVWLFALVHIRGVGPGRLASNALTILKVGLVADLHRAGPHDGRRPATNLQQSAGPVTATGWFAGLIVVMFVYSGWNAAAYMAEEVRDPGATCRWRWRWARRR